MTATQNHPDEIDVSFFRRDLYPYCLMKAHDKHGGHVILNRKYQPLSFSIYGNRDNYSIYPFIGHDCVKHVWYEDMPPRVRIKKITKKTAKFLSWNNSDNTDRIHLYADHILPTRNKTNWDNYSEKLFKLGQLRTTFK